MYSIDLEEMALINPELYEEELQNRKLQNDLFLKSGVKNSIEDLNEFEEMMQEMEKDFLKERKQSLAEKELELEKYLIEDLDNDIKKWNSVNAN
jgi:hypothetical protein